MTRTQSIFIGLAAIVLVVALIVLIDVTTGPETIRDPVPEHPAVDPASPPPERRLPVDPEPGPVREPVFPPEPFIDSPVEDVDRIPRLRFPERPEYPEALRDNGEEVDVRVRVAIDATGQVTRAEVIDSPDPAFDEPALEAASRYHFEPAMRGGVTVPFTMETTVTFEPKP